MQFQWFYDLRDLFFPNFCAACEQHPPLGNEVLCLQCRNRLPQTAMHRMPENRFTDRFFGRVYLQTGAALYHFREGNGVQQLIHRLKYGNRPQLGQALGRYYGRMLREEKIYADIDLIIPVPLHPIRERQRGYNQSDWFAKGLAETMQRPHLSDGLRRTKHSKSQVRKSATERLTTMLNAFEVNRQRMLRGRHVLLVDDVLTTGATLEACASQLLKLPGTKVSMATIAIAGAV